MKLSIPPPNIVAKVEGPFVFLEATSVRLWLLDTADENKNEPVLYDTIRAFAAAILAMEVEARGK